MSSMRPRAPSIPSQNFNSITIWNSWPSSGLPLLNPSSKTRECGDSFRSFISPKDPKINYPFRTFFNYLPPSATTMSPILAKKKLWKAWCITAKVFMRIVLYPKSITNWLIPDKGLQKILDYSFLSLPQIWSSSTKYLFLDLGLFWSWNNSEIQSKIVQSTIFWMLHTLTQIVRDFPKITIS